MNDDDEDERRARALELWEGLNPNPRGIAAEPLKATFGGVLHEASSPRDWWHDTMSERDEELVPAHEAVDRLAPLVGTPALARFWLEDLLAGGRLGPIYAKTATLERHHYPDGNLPELSPKWERDAPRGCRIADNYPELWRWGIEQPPPPVLISLDTEGGVATYRSDEEDDHGTCYIFTLTDLAIHSAAVNYITDATGATPPPSPEELRPKGRPTLDGKDEAIAAVVAMLRRGEFRRREGVPIKADVQQAIAEQLGRESKLRDDGTTDFGTTVRRYADEAIERYRRGD